MPGLAPLDGSDAIDPQESFAALNSIVLGTAPFGAVIERIAALGARTQ